jgi:hypothetical protein
MYYYSQRSHRVVNCWRRGHGSGWGLTPVSHVVGALRILEMSGYEQNPKSTKPKDTDVEAKAAYGRTVARLDKLTEQVATAPRGKTLVGKVCIITGVGSLRGIGSVRSWSRGLSLGSLINM